MEFSTPYNLTKHITENFYTNLHSSKWSERKDAIQGLIDVMEKNPVFVPNDLEYQKLIDDLSKILSKDSNINVAAASAQALGKMALGTAKTFNRSAPDVILLCLTRMKDVKPVIKNACTECLDSSYSSTPIKKGLSITAPGSKIQTCEFFTRIMLKIDFPTAKNSAAGTKEVVDQLCKLALGSDVACREGAMRALASFMRAVTKNIALPLLAPVATTDKLKMEKIEEFYEKFIVEYPFDDGSKKVEATGPSTSSSANGTTTVENDADEPAEVDIRLFATPYDLTKNITEELYTNLHSSKWSERKDAIQGLIDVMEKNPVLVPNDLEYQKLIDDLSKILAKDSNINVTAAAAQALGKLAYGTAKTFSRNAPDVILLCLTRMKDVKPAIKNACSDCLDSSYSSTTFANVLEPIKKGLAITAPGSKIQTCEFFTRIMLKIDFVTAKNSAAGTKEIIDQLCKLALGADVACREGAMKSLASFMRAVTKNIALPLLAPVATTDKLKMEKIEEFYEKFIVEYPFKQGKVIASAPTSSSNGKNCVVEKKVAAPLVSSRRSTANITVRSRNSSKEKVSAPVIPPSSNGKSSVMEKKVAPGSSSSTGKDSVIEKKATPISRRRSSANITVRPRNPVVATPISSTPKTPIAKKVIPVVSRPDSRKSVTYIPLTPMVKTPKKAVPVVVSRPNSRKSMAVPISSTSVPKTPDLNAAPPIAATRPDSRRSMIRPPTVVVRPNRDNAGSRQIL